MPAKKPDDDLFRDSTMTFGEHLEELRGALFRSLIGLMAGFGLGLGIATYVVRFIETPLKNSLEDYYVETALLDLGDEYGDTVPPELRTLIVDEGLLPDSILVEPFSFIESLSETFPDQFGQLQFPFPGFIPEDIELGRVAPLCARVAKRAATEGSPEETVWIHLSSSQREQVQALAKKKPIQPEDRRQLIQILNSIVDDRHLAEAKAFENLTELVPAPAVRHSVSALRESVKKEFDQNQSRRLNRFLLASAFSDYIREPRVPLVEMATWKPVKVRVQTLNAHEAFMIWIKAALIAGVIVASPWIFWQIWNFVAAGLYSQEKRYVYVFLPISLSLFFAGSAMAFFFVFEPVLTFLFSFNRKMNIDPDPRISEWLNFVLFLPLGFGISFQLPLVMLFLERIGIFTVESYLSRWRIAILVIFVLAMFLTPADPVSMLLMAVPLTVLYFGGILMCHWMPKRASPFGDVDEP